MLYNNGTREKKNHNGGATQAKGRQATAEILEWYPKGVKKRARSEKCKKKTKEKRRFRRVREKNGIVRSKT